MAELVDEWGHLRSALHENHPDPARIKSALSLFEEDFEYQYAVNYALASLLNRGLEDTAKQVAVLCSMEYALEDIRKAFASATPAVKQAAAAMNNLGAVMARFSRSLNRTLAPVAAAAARLDEEALERIAQAGVDGAQAGRELREQLGDGEEE